MNDEGRTRQLARLRRIRLLRAQRELQALRAQRQQWQHTLEECTRRRRLHHAEQQRCLQQANPAAPDHALRMAACTAHARNARVLAGRIDDALRQLASMAPALEAAVATLRKAQHLCEQPLPAPRRRAAAGCTGVERLAPPVTCRAPWKRPR